ncbi:MAG: ribonuclease P protein component [Spirochaetaceae bacterium]|jgi:ribonuclease P protein component|nr:ribonuclease P protein component [Spirochaetaceae bacterium]
MSKAESGAAGINTVYNEKPEKKLGFPRQEHLKRREDIQTVFKKGASASCAGARLFFLRGEGCGRRIAFTFARKFGNAVQRNRSRRLGRESYRHLRQEIKSGYDLVLLLYPCKSGLTGSDLPESLSLRMGQMKVLLGKAGLFAEKMPS